MKNQITKETVYRIPADVKRESAVTLQEKHLLQKFTNILREDGKNYWFNAERFLRTAEEYNFTVSSMMRDIDYQSMWRKKRFQVLRRFADYSIIVNIQMRSLWSEFRRLNGLEKRCTGIKMRSLKLSMKRVLAAWQSSI